MRMGDIRGEAMVTSVALGDVCICEVFEGDEMSAMDMEEQEQEQERENDGVRLLMGKAKWSIRRHPRHDR